MSIQDAHETVSVPGRDRDVPVLLVDDDALILETVGDVLAHLGYRPVSAATGEEALAKLAAGLKPLLVILDLDMPGMGGAETLVHLRRLRPDLPVVIASGRLNAAAVELAQRLPGVSLMPKPYGLREIKARLG